MTMAEFDIWIEQHYGELLAVAKQRSNEPEDVLHAAIAGMYASSALDMKVKYPCSTEDEANGFLAVWPWAVGFVRGHASVKRRSQRRDGTKHLPVHLRSGEELVTTDTKTEERSKLKRLPKEKDALRYADKYYLQRLEEDRRDFDMEGYGRALTPDDDHGFMKLDPPFTVRFEGDRDEHKPGPVTITKGGAA